MSGKEFWLGQAVVCVEKSNDFPINDCQVKMSDTAIKTSNAIDMRLVGPFQKPCGNYLILVRLTVERLLYNFVSSTSVGLNSEKCFSKPDVDCIYRPYFCDSDERVRYSNKRSGASVKTESETGGRRGRLSAFVYP